MIINNVSKIYLLILHTIFVLHFVPNLSFFFSDDVSNMVVLVLNTLYFKGSWRHQFAPNETKTGPFYVSPKIQKTIPFMNVNDKFYYTESTKYDAKILRMPYMVSFICCCWNSIISLYCFYCWETVRLSVGER